MSSSVRLSSVCLSSVCNVRAPYSGYWNFRQCFYVIIRRYTNHQITLTQYLPSLVLGDRSFTGRLAYHGGFIWPLTSQTLNGEVKHGHGTHQLEVIYSSNRIFIDEDVIKSHTANFKWNIVFLGWNGSFRDVSSGPAAGTSLARLERWIGKPIERSIRGDESDVWAWCGQRAATDET